MASILDFNNDNLLALYSKSFGEIDNTVNSILPKLYWAEQVCEWRGDYAEADLFRDYSQRAIRSLSEPQYLVRLTRDELARRDPAKWGGLKTRVEANSANYMNPDLYDAWKETHE